MLQNYYLFIFLDYFSMKKLYIGGISYSTSEETLRAACEAITPIVSAKIMTDKFSGRSRGFGFVEVETEEGMNALIAALHDKELDGRVLSVNEAQPMTERAPRQDNEDRPRRSFGGQSRGGFGGGNRGGYGSRGGFGGGNDRGGFSGGARRAY